MQLGIRAHDVAYAPFDQLVKKVREQGFSCIHVALGKSIKEFDPGIAAMTPGLAMYMKRVCLENKIDIAVLGNYCNLCHPDPEVHEGILKRYVAHMRFASLLGCGVVGTETGACNAGYCYEPHNHSEEAFRIFVKNLVPVVEAAERFGVILAIEPVWKHIIYSPRRARRVLDEIASPNLQIILDPVNLLCRDNLEQQDEIISEAFDLLCDDIAVIHMKDFRIEGDDLRSIPAGEGGLNYDLLLKRIKAYKPFVHCTLENTSPDNAVRTREFVQNLYETV